ncbi:MAG: shikimate kinase [Bacteroidota bacterium]
MKLEKRLYLVGFMASGKSFVGKRLAERLQAPFVDLDDRIEAAAQMSIAELFAVKGEAYFRALERDCLHKTAQEAPLIVACGGGTPCFFDNMQWIKSNGMSLFLDVAPAVIAQRLEHEMAHRPLLSHLSLEELEAFIVQKLDERGPYYQQADIRYEVTSTEDEVIEHLMAFFLQITGH